MRYYSTVPIHLEYHINRDLENEVYKPKNHPGRTGLKTIEIPQQIQKAIELTVNGLYLHCSSKMFDFIIYYGYVPFFLEKQVSQLLEEGQRLDRYLFARKVPLEQKETYIIKKKIEDDLLKNRIHGLKIIHYYYIVETERLKELKFIRHIRTSFLSICY